MTDEPKTDMLSAQVEAKMVLGQVVADVLHKTGAMLVPTAILLCSSCCCLRAVQAGTADSAAVQQLLRTPSSG
jgi:hypothetical protein